MIQVKFGEQSNVRYNTGVLQKCELASGTMGAIVFLDKNPVVIDSSWSPTVKRYVDPGTPEFFSKHVADLQEPRRRYYFLVARFDMDDQRQVISNSFRLEYLDLPSGTYTEFYNATVAQQSFNGAILTKVDKKLKDKDISYIKPYPSMLQLPQDASEKVSRIMNDPTEVSRLWEEFKKCVGIISAEEFEQRLNGNVNVAQTAQATQTASTAPTAPTAQATQVAPTAPTAQTTQSAQQNSDNSQQGTQMTASFGNDPFISKGGSDLPF